MRSEVKKKAYKLLNKGTQYGGVVEVRNKTVIV